MCTSQDPTFVCLLVVFRHIWLFEKLWKVIKLKFVISCSIRWIAYNVLSISYSMRRNFRQTLKFSSNLIVYLLFLFFAVSKKKKESLWNIFFSNHATFSISWRWLKIISQEQFKKTQQPTITISRFIENFYASNMRWRAHKSIKTKYVFHLETKYLLQTNILVQILIFDLFDLKKELLVFWNCQDQSKTTF